MHFTKLLFLCFLIRSAQDVWYYFSVKSGSSIHQFSDSQIGHVFAKGHDRAQAIK